MRRGIITGLLAGLALVLPSAAHAEGSVGVLLFYHGVPTGPHGVGHLTCVGAVEKLLSMTDVPLWTNVTCTLAGRQESTTVPGGVATATVVNTLVPPFVVCATAWTAFLDPNTNRAYVVTKSLCGTRSTV